jgi:hypothetical protein
MRAWRKVKNYHARAVRVASVLARSVVFLPKKTMAALRGGLGGPARESGSLGCVAWTTPSVSPGGLRRGVPSAGGSPVPLEPPVLYDPHCLALTSVDNWCYASPPS